MVSRAEVIELELPCNEHAPSVVRHALTEAVDGPWVMGDAMLVASELVTNAVRHSGCGEDHQILIRLVWREPEHLMIEVRDPGLTNQRAELRDCSAGGGFGLHVVNQLAVSWGSERTDGYRVWADVPLSDGPLDLPAMG